MRNFFINRNFFLIWSGSLVSLIGDKFYLLVLSLWVLDRYDSPFIMGMVLLASSLPSIVIGIFSGVFADMKNKKHIMVFTDFLRGVILILLCILEWNGALLLWHIITASVLISTLNAFFNPASKAMIPRVVANEQLASANALMQFNSGFSSIIGPLFGAVAIGTVGYAGGFLIDGISFVLSAIFEMFIKYRRSVEKAIEKTGYFFKIKEGFRFLKSNSMLIRVLYIIGIVHFAWGSTSLIFPFFADFLGGGEMRLGILQGASGLGLMIGAAWINIKFLKNRPNKLLLLILALLGLFYCGIAICLNFGSNSIILYAIFVVFFGILISNAATFWALLIQVNTPENMQGRVFSLASMIGDSSTPLSYAIVGFALEYVFFGWYLGVLGAVLMVSAVLVRGRLR